MYKWLCVGERNRGVCVCVQSVCGVDVKVAAAVFECVV